MSLSRLCAGRKRDSEVWKFFSYNEKTDKTTCLVILGNSKPCGTTLSGKNTTNLKVSTHVKFTTTDKIFRIKDVIMRKDNQL